MNILKISISVFIIFLFSNCNSIKYTPKEFKKYIEKGNIQNLSPKSSDRVGKLYRINSNNVRFSSKTFDLKKSTENIELPEISITRKLKAKSVLKLLNIPLNTNLNLSTKKNVSFKIKNPEYFVSEDEDLLKIFPEIKEIISSIEKEFGVNSFYIIREAILTNEYELDIEIFKKGDAKLAIDIDNAVKNDSSLEWDNSEKTVVKFKSEKPLVVFYKPQKINYTIFGSGITGTDSIVLKPSLNFKTDLKYFNNAIENNLND